MQEVKCNESVLSKCAVPEGYTPYWFASERPGYCGVAVLTRVVPDRVVYGLQDENLDKEARVITLWFSDFVLVNIYAPYSGRWLNNIEKRIKWENRFFDHMRSLMSGSLPVIVCGDFNVASSEWDVSKSEVHPYVAGATVTERAAFRRLLNLGFTDVFRHLNPYTKEAYSFWRYGGNHRQLNQGWRFDYFLVSQSILPAVECCKICKELNGSDHCPVSLSLKF